MVNKLVGGVLMFIYFLLIVFSIYIRRFVPAKGFLCDNSIEALTAFGSSRRIELRNLDSCDIEDMVCISDRPTHKTPKPIADVVNDNGIDLKDIKAKQCDEVDTNYMYGNMDASDESLADTLRKGGLGR